ncbi:MAG TPA: carbohydrate-binding module family 20 domain-containing protein, partial [Burkholderiaceae bacterium]|nr:carbohydrate-binding module family 20 domain-containing protein [Burkholderiaceae bacterium]
TGRKIKSFDLAGKAQESDEIVIDKLSVNGISYGKTVGVTLSPWGLTLGGKQPNPGLSVLGLGFFEGKKVVIDYASKTLTISSEDDASIMKTVAGWSVIPFDRSKAGMVMVFNGDNGSYRMVLDSPSTSSVVRTRIAEERDHVQHCDLKLEPGRTCQSISMSFPGGHAITALLTDLPERFPEDGVVGQDFFFQNAVFLDLKNRSIMIKSNTACATVPVTFRVTDGDTLAGQNLYVNGNLQALGNWDPTAVNQLHRDSGSTQALWSTTIPLPPVTPIQFKFMKHGGNDDMWEAKLPTKSGNREVRTPACDGPALVLDAGDFHAPASVEK